MSEESIASPSTTDKSLDPELIYFNDECDLEIKWIYLEGHTVTFLHKNLYITYKLDKWFKDLNPYFTLGNSLFEATKLT